MHFAFHKDNNKEDFIFLESTYFIKKIKDVVFTLHIIHCYKKNAIRLLPSHRTILSQLINIITVISTIKVGYTVILFCPMSELRLYPKL